MATSIPQAFLKLKQELQITQLQGSTVSTRQQNVRKAVENGMKVLNSFLTGSYVRDTMITPLKEADIDIFVVLDSQYFEQYGQASLLDKVRRVLISTYPSTPNISRNGQAVTITFTDFKVDVVPAFYRNGGGYLIPDSTSQRWIATDPRKHVELWSAANKAQDGNLVPLLKMLKAWNKTHGATLSSFHLETLALQALSGVTIFDYPSGVRFVLDKARTLIQSPLPDPAGYAGNVGILSITQRQTAAQAIGTAFERCLAAEKLAREGNIAQAMEKWRLIFGTYFPTYG